MKRHLLGGFLFIAVLGGAAIVAKIFKGIKSPSEIDQPLSRVTGIPHQVIFVQYDNRAERLTARLEVNREMLKGRSSIPVVVILQALNSTRKESRFDVVGEVSHGQSENAIVTAELERLSGVVLPWIRGYNASFGVGANGKTAQLLDASDFGEPQQVVFVTNSESKGIPKSATPHNDSGGTGPIILR